MDESEFLDRLGAQPGVVLAVRMPDDLYRRILEEESSVTGAGGHLPVRNVGLEECTGRTDRYCVFLGSGSMLGLSFDPDFHSMVMRDRAGQVVGFDIHRDRIPEWRERDDVVFLSDDFVLFTGVTPVGRVEMEIRARPYRGVGDWIPESADPVIWFPCSTSTVLMGDRCGIEVERVSASIVALNLDG